MQRRTTRTIGFAAAVAAGALAVLPAASASAAPHKVKVRHAVGTSPAAIQSAVDAYRADLGEPNNVATPGSQAAGRREINWDGVPDAVSAPNLLPPDFFNVNSPRGAVFSTPGSGVQVSGNAGIAPIEFDNLDPTASAQFRTFSPQRLFSAVGSNVVDVHFRKPGTDEPATVSGFGAVFTDVDRLGSTTISYYDRHHRRIGTWVAPALSGRETLSFLGVRFKRRVVAHVRIRSGNVALGRGEGGRRDIVVMDDFLYGEPR